MKQFITPKYEFIPGNIGDGYINLSYIPNFNINRLVAIINQTRGKVLYSTGTESLNYLTITNNKLFFGIDTNTYSSSDEIQIIYDSETETLDMTLMLNNLLTILATPGIRDKTLNADRVAVINTVATTVTTVSALNSYQAQLPVINNNIAAWYLSCRSKIT